MIAYVPAIARLLPEVFQQTMVPGGLLPGLLEVMTTLHEPCEQRLANLELTFDPRRTSDAFVPFLARWVCFEHLHSDAAPRAGSGLQVCVDSPGHLRELIAVAYYLAQWRGTQRGLIRFLATATGLQGFRIEEPLSVGAESTVQPFHLRIFAPLAAKRQVDLLHKVIGMGKPAHVTYDLEFDA
jgi:phage tail-like protein